MREPVYEVFARKTREEPLKHIGYINALNGELARVCAWTTYDEQNWFEMCVIPRSAILAVNLEQGPFAEATRASPGHPDESPHPRHPGESRDPGPNGTKAGDEIIHNTGTGAYGGSEVA